MASYCSIWHCRRDVKEAVHFEETAFFRRRRGRWVQEKGVSSWELGGQHVGVYMMEKVDVEE